MPDLADAMADLTGAMSDHIRGLEDTAAQFQPLVRRCARLNRRGQVAELTRLLGGAAKIPTLHRLPRGPIRSVDIEAGRSTAAAET